MRKTSVVVLVISVLFFLSGCDSFNKEESEDSYQTAGNTDDVVSIAYSAIGCPYEWGAAGPYSFDASGLVCFCYGYKGHVWTTHTFVGPLAGWNKISAIEAKPGDVVSSTGHCGIYIGGGQMIHAPQPGDVVKIGSVQGDMGYYRLFLP